MLASPLAAKRSDDALNPAPPPRRRYWIAFVATFCLAVIAAVALVYSPQQDQPGSIPLRGDGSWYHNYEPNFEIQDNDIFYHGIGASIRNAQQADIIFLGTSKVLFGLDRDAFAAFEARHHLKMFDMAFAGVASGEFSARIIHKWNLRPKIWVIDLFSGADPEAFDTSFFDPSLLSSSGFGSSAVARVVAYSDAQALKNVIGRNLRWRTKAAIGLLADYPYRSATTGNWYLDTWPGHTGPGNQKMNVIVGTHCPAPAVEIEAAKHFAAEIGGQIVLTQIPSAFSCDQRVHDLAAALGAPALTVSADQFTSADAGGHLDASGARKYSQAFFAWLEQLPEFKTRFSP